MVLDFGQIWSVLRWIALPFFQGKMWHWEKSESFDLWLQELQDNEIEIPMTWFDCYGNPVKVGGEIAACQHDSFERIRMRILRYFSSRWKLMIMRWLRGFLFKLWDNVGLHRGGTIWDDGTQLGQEAYHLIIPSVDQGVEACRCVGTPCCVFCLERGGSLAGCESVEMFCMHVSSK